MDELIKKVAERTGLGEDKARTAVDTVIGFLKEKLPAPIGGQIDNVVGGRRRRYCGQGRRYHGKYRRHVREVGLNFTADDTHSVPAVPVLLDSSEIR